MKLQDKISALKSESAQLEKLLQHFPDLKQHVNRWKTIRLQSKSVNSQATAIDTWHSCGCCNDSPLLASPYIVFHGQKIYSDPMEIYVGERTYGNYCKDNWVYNWEEILKKHEISQQAIDSIRHLTETEQTEEEY